MEIFDDFLGKYARRRRKLDPNPGKNHGIFTIVTGKNWNRENFTIVTGQQIRDLRFSE